MEVGGWRLKNRVTCVLGEIREPRYQMSTMRMMKAEWRSRSLVLPRTQDASQLYLDNSKQMYRPLYHDFFWFSPPEVLEEAEGLLHSHPNLHQLELVCDEELGDPSMTGGDLEVETPLAIFVFKSFPETAS